MSMSDPSASEAYAELIRACRAAERLIPWHRRIGTRLSMHWDEVRYAVRKKLRPQKTKAEADRGSVERGYRNGWRMVNGEDPKHPAPRWEDMVRPRRDEMYTFAYMAFLNGYLDAKRNSGVNSGAFRSSPTAYVPGPSALAALWEDEVAWAEAERTGVGVDEATDRLLARGLVFPVG